MLGSLRCWPSVPGRDVAPSAQIRSARLRALLVQAVSLRIQDCIAPCPLAIANNQLKERADVQQIRTRPIPPENPYLRNWSFSVTAGCAVHQDCGGSKSSFCF